MTNKNNTALWALIVILFIGGLILITRNNTTSVQQTSQLGAVLGNDMDNTQETKGVQITTTKEGTGEAAKAGDTVAMNYTGRLADGTVFDSNIDPKFQHVEPFVFTIGEGMVIKGWDVGIAGMKVGEKRTLVIDPDYAYGAAGAGGVIPPNAALTFEVELVAIK